jgi:transposase-like protein
MANETKVRMNTKAAVALDDAVEGARRATGDASSSAPPNPEVAATARRRQFSMEERLRILALADACTEPGDIGALLRREGIYSSHLTTWRKQRTAAELAALAPQKRGRKADPALAEARRLDQLTRENDRLRRQLAQAHTIINVQKKVCTLLGLLADETPDGKS